MIEKYHETAKASGAVVRLAHASIYISLQVRLTLTF